MILYEDTALVVLDKPAGLSSEEGVPADIFGNPQKQETKDFLSRFRNA